jgi:hypothetical protein
VRESRCRRIRQERVEKARWCGGVGAMGAEVKKRVLFLSGGDVMEPKYVIRISPFPF